MNLKTNLLTLALVLTFALSSFAQQNTQIRALVFSKTAGFRHQSIPEGVAALKKTGSNPCVQCLHHGRFQPFYG